MNLHCRQRTVSFPRRPLVMGIVNVNDDSFCGDGSLDIQTALQQACDMVAAGADFIDVGAESARTNRGVISVPMEIERLKGFVTAFQSVNWPAPVDAQQVHPPLLSINTWRPEVVDAILPLGGDLLNDIGGLPDAANAQTCARHGAALLIMHSVGEPKIPHTDVFYEDIMGTLDAFFREKIALAQSAGLSLSQLVIDPGIDFAKQRDDNLKIFAAADRVQIHGVPVLFPVSRKSVIGQVLELPNPLDREAGTVACVVAGMNTGVQIFRVHNVSATLQTIQTIVWLS